MDRVNATIRGRLRAAARRPWLTVPVGLALAWLLFAWLGFEPLVKWAVPKYLAAHGGRVATIGQARLDPLRLTLDIAGLKLAEPDGKPLLALGRLVADFELSSIVERAYTFREIRVESPVVAVELAADGRVNWAQFAAGFADSSAASPPAAVSPSPDAGDTAPPRLKVGLLAVADGRVEFVDHRNADGFRTDLHALALEVHDLSTLPGARARHHLSAQLGLGGAVQWRGELALNPVEAGGELVADALVLARLQPYLARHLDIAPPGGRAKLSVGYSLGLPDGRVALRIERAELRVDGLSLAGGQSAQPALRIDTIALAGGRFDLAGQEGELESVRVAGGRLVLQRLADGGLDLARWLVPDRADRAGRASGDAGGAASGDPTPPASPTGAAGAARPWRVRVGRLEVDGLAAHYTDRGFASPLIAEAGRVALGLRADARLGAGDATVTIDELGAELADLRVSSDALAEPALTMTRAVLEGGRLSLSERSFAAARLAFTGGRVAGTRDADGRLPLLEALRPIGGSAPTGASEGAVAPGSGTPAAAAGGWRARADVVAIDGFALSLRDASTTPTAVLGLQDITLQAKNVSEDLAAPVAVQASLRVDAGGRFEASGEVVPGEASADLRVRLAGLALRPAQPYVARHARVDLVEGQVDTDGRLALAGGGFRYTGALDVRGLRVNEAEGGERLLAWRSLSTPRLELTPQGLKIGELRADGLGAKLVIFEDRRVNFARVLVQGNARDDAPPAPSVAPLASPAPAPVSGRERATSPPFRVDVERVALTGGEVDFADLSLALPFGTRVHGVAGGVVGVSNVPGGRARLQLEGHVDDYGLARAAGEIDLFEPMAFTDTKVVFRNVEMSRLTPYSATFAGRRIASGKLSLDLEYRIENKALVGDNKVVIEKLTLGEKVESKRATELPLDLAIALLQDGDGVIDLGLPVSGQLDSVEVSIGGLVWKAFTNVLTKIVTAPFRALGALLGVDGEQLSSIAFDPGRSVLLPPAREKLGTVAGILGKRPRLAVTIGASADPESDAQALREQRLRRRLAAEAVDGVAGRAAESGPLPLADPALLTALERLYTQRVGAERLHALKQRFDAASQAPVGGAGAADASGAPPRATSGAPARARSGLGEAMLRELIATEPLDAQDLNALAERRAAVVRDELLARGVSPARIESLAAGSALAGTTDEGANAARGAGTQGTGTQGAGTQGAAPTPGTATLTLAPMRAGAGDAPASTQSAPASPPAGTTR